MPTHCVGFGENSRWLVKLSPKASANGTMMKSRIRPNAGAAIAQPARFEDKRREPDAAMAFLPRVAGPTPWAAAVPDGVNQALTPG